MLEPDITVPLYPLPLEVLVINKKQDQQTSDVFRIVLWTTDQ